MQYIARIQMPQQFPAFNIRPLIWGAIAFFALGLGSWKINADGNEAGVLRFGGRVLKEISKATDPEDFERWSAFFTISTIAWSTLGCLALALAWKRRNS
jgi:hypothetical protein